VLLVVVVVVLPAGQWKQVRQREWKWGACGVFGAVLGCREICRVCLVCVVSVVAQDLIINAIFIEFLQGLFALTALHFRQAVATWFQHFLAITSIPSFFLRQTTVA
jgi:hypothetical protein